MPLSPVGPAFPEIEQIKKEIKAIKRDIQNLKLAHDAVAAELKAAILSTQRWLARETIRNMGNGVLEDVRRIVPSSAKIFEQQMVNELTATRAAIKSSDAPLTLASEFHDKLKSTANKLGIHFLDEGL